MFCQDAPPKHLNTEGIFRKTEKDFVFSFKNLVECNNVGSIFLVVNEKALSALRKNCPLVPVFHVSAHARELNPNFKSIEGLSGLHKKMSHKEKVINMLKAADAEKEILEEYKKVRTS